MADVLHLAAVILRDTHILRENDADIIFFLVEIFGKRTDNICQSAGLDKRNAFRSCK